MLQTTRARRRRRSPLLLVLIAVAGVVGLTIALVLPLRWWAPPTTSFMLQDESGREPVAYEWQDWSGISSSLSLAVVAAEDQKFGQHFGLDLESIRDSFEDSERGGRLRGASTISQQVAKNLFLWPGRSFVRKGLEAWLALALEVCLPKRRILEIYLNIAEFGPGIYGVAAAAEHYFGKPPSAVTDAEAALLAAVLPNPRQLRLEPPSAYVAERQQWILSHMHRLRREQWLLHLQ